jgi:hypothetical protein
MERRCDCGSGFWLVIVFGVLFWMITIFARQENQRYRMLADHVAYRDLHQHADRACTPKWPDDEPTERCR